MPPRYAYWTILVDGQPTAFRSSAQEELMPTFRRLKEKHPSAEMKWFQNGKLWDSRVDAQESMRERGDRGRMGDQRQAGFRSRKLDDRRPRSGGEGRPKSHAASPKSSEKLEWKPKGEFTPPPPRERSEQSDGSDSASGGDRPEWQPKGAPRPKSVDRPARSFDRDRKPDWKAKGSFDRERKPDWKPKGTFDPDRKPDWKPKGAFDRDRKPDWKPKSTFDRDRKPDWKPKSTFDRAGKPDWKPKSTFDRDRKPDWKPKGTFDRGRKPDWKSRTAKPQDRGGARPAHDRERPEWKPKGDTADSRFPTPDSRRPTPDSRGKRKWVPKEEYKKSKGIERPRDSKWRPGGDHRDPKQKYKDAKKAKWTKFKQNIRQRREGSAGRKKDDDK